MRILLPTPAWRHQRVQFNIHQSLHRFEEASGTGFALGAPFDVLIQRNPLRTRQPDVLCISRERLSQGGGIPERGVLAVAPELVVEIISDSERQRDIDAKIVDYVAVGVKECWRVWPESRTVEVLRLTRAGAEVVATYDETQFLQSITFADLMIAITEFFKS